MSTSHGMLLLPRAVADALMAGSGSGSLIVRIDPVDNVALVIGHRPDGSESGRADRTDPFVRRHYTSSAEEGPLGRYRRASRDLHAMATWADRRDAHMKTSALRELLPGRLNLNSTTEFTPVLTYAPDAEDPVPTWLAWWVSDTHALRGNVHIVDPDIPAVQPLERAWPVATMADTHIAVIGVGSIGSAAAAALARAATGQLTLIDPDRLLQHNIIRHTLGLADLGRHKATALAQLLSERYPQLKVQPHGWDVTDDADIIRTRLTQWDVVVVATDGVESRLAANWLTAAAKVPAVFACVLENGALGEVLLTAPNAGCLLCHRATQRDRGQLDPESGIDLGYGTGSRHRPMTAVGTDLQFVGQLAAKAAVATVLERSGLRDQRIGANHAAIGLRPDRSFPAPFDDLHNGSIRWTTFTQRADCHVCTRP